jgi:hypothetical protein
MSCSAVALATTVNLCQDYLDLIDPRTMRARTLTEVERIPSKLKEMDEVEGKGVVKLFLTALKFTTSAIIEGNLSRFDATIGDHACQVSASFVISTLGDKLQEEAKRLHAIAVEGIKRVASIRCKEVAPPCELIAPFCPQISREMDYFVRAYMLRQGRQLSVTSDGVISLKILPHIIKDKFSHNCPIELVKQLISRFRVRMNADSLTFVQKIGTDLLRPEEGRCLEDRYVKSHLMPFGVTLKFPCAFYSVKAILLLMAKSGVTFAVGKYDPSGVISHAPLLFREVASEGEIPRMERVSSEELSEASPVFMIEGYFKEGMSPLVVANEIEKYGLIRFALASIATYPQFIDMSDSEYLEDEDLAELPSENQMEIKRYRSEGRRLGCNTADPAFLKIIHIHATTLKDLYYEAHSF